MQDSSPLLAGSGHSGRSASLLKEIEAGYRALQQGHPQQALDFFLTASERAPHLPAAWHGLGLASDALASREDAARFLKKACSLSEQTGLYWRDLARALLNGGDAEAALASAEKALSLEPDDPVSVFLYAQALSDLRRYPEAVEAYGQVLALQPDSPMALNNLGNVMRAIDRHEEAAELYRMALRADPGHAEAWHNLGAIHSFRQEWPQAAACEAEAVNHRPNFWQGFLGLGLALSQQKRYDEAQTCLERARAIVGEHADVLMELGNLAVARHRGDEAMAWYLRAANADTRSIGALVNAGNLLRINGRNEEALSLARRAVTQEPASAIAHNLAGNCLGDLGRMREALECFQKAVACDPKDRVAFSNLLYNLNFHSAFSPEHVFALHQAWGRDTVDAAQDSRTAPRTAIAPGKRLRVGYVSGDFRRHSVMYFLGPLLRRHNREQFEVYCYSNLDREDTLTAQIKQLDLVWRDITALSDEAACRQVVEDEIDILVDLAGHTGGNRLGIFARKPAPLQCTYLGYPNTTGLPTMDYRIVDAITDPTGNAEGRSMERLARLPHGFLCFSPPGNQLDTVLDDAGRMQPCHLFAQGVAPELPENRRGYLTLGTFNNSKKIDVESAVLWGSALAALPGSKLLLKGKAYQNAQSRESLFRVLAQGGIPPERVELRHNSPSLEEHLAQYNDMDIALDTFPYNGTTTTCEALWMGVPVVTLAGERHAGRVGASLLRMLGHPEWVAESREGFAEACARLASDQERRFALRQSLREEMLGSPLMDETGFVQSLEAFYQSAWQELCDRGNDGGGATPS
ncbi:MAG: tetratricopeptide repeat protein [Bryobacterales bacterium]|nr:tetratricopeptide repeat protein [Bryobacterales bacterium]